MLLTLGGIGFWALIDVFFLGGRLDDVNRRTKREIFSRHGIPTV